VKREALESALTPGGLDAHAPARVVDVHVLGDGRAVVADAVEWPAHVVDEEAAGARLVDEQHHAGWLAPGVGNGRELLESHADSPIGGDRCRKRIARRLRESGAREHQEGDDAAAGVHGSLLGLRRLATFRALKIGLPPRSGKPMARALDSRRMRI
jgi:hypothetical protein